MTKMTAMLMSNEQIVYLGDKSLGAKPGDRRILNWRLHSEDGSHKGNLHIVSTVLDDTPNGHLIASVGTLRFPDGEVHVSQTNELLDAAREDISSAGPAVFAITGGTGAYAHVSGDVTTGPPNENPQSLSDWTVNITMKHGD